MPPASFAATLSEADAAAPSPVELSATEEDFAELDEEGLRVEKVERE